VGGATPDTDRLVGAADPRIKRIGHVPQAVLPDLYRQASVFVMPSIEEGQAMVQAQALACGLPLVCTAHTGGEDFLELDGPGRDVAAGVKEYSAGYVVPSGNPEAMASALGRLAADPGRLAAMRLAAMTLAERDLSWGRYAAANLARYQSILAGRIQAGAREPMLHRPAILT